MKERAKATEKVRRSVKNRQNRGEESFIRLTGAWVLTEHLEEAKEKAKIAFNKTIEPYRKKRK